MYLTIRRLSIIDKRGFTLVEALTTSLIALYIVGGAWATYMMCWSWWHEIGPEVEVQRIARVAISSIIEGKTDPTSGTFTIGTSTYARKNGIAQAVAAPTLNSSQSISYRLEPDSSNVRSFYLDVDPDTNLNVVYYRDSSAAIHKLNSTIGITDLRFEYYPGSNNMIMVTATVERDVTGTGTAPHHVHAAYTEIAYLRSVPNA